MLPKINPADLENKGVVGLPDTPALSAMEMQEKFDELALDVIVPKYNALLDVLAGTEGAGEIGTSLGGTVQAVLDSIETGKADETEVLQIKSDIEELQINKADKSNVLEKNNVSEFTPTGNYQPATKKYVDDKVVEAGAGDMLKSVYDPQNTGTVLKAEHANDSDKLGNTPAENYTQWGNKNKTVTLTTVGWSGNTQTVTASEVSPASVILCGLSLENANIDSAKEAYSHIYAAEALDSQIKFYADEAPTSELKLTLAVMK